MRGRSLLPQVYPRGKFADRVFVLMIIISDVDFARKILSSAISYRLKDDERARYGISDEPLPGSRVRKGLMLHGGVAAESQARDLWAFREGRK